MDFKNALWDLVLGTGELSPSFKGSKILVFAVGSMVMGLLTIILDRVVFSVLHRQSFFKLRYGKESFWFLLFFFGLGAGVGGFLGSAASIFQITRGACISMGVGWPLVLSRL